MSPFPTVFTEFILNCSVVNELTSPSEVLDHQFLNWLVRWFITVSVSFCGWSSGNGETKIQECAKRNNT
jgi:hypothetical protein